MYNYIEPSSALFPNECPSYVEATPGLGVADRRLLFYHEWSLISLVQCHSSQGNVIHERNVSFIAMDIH